MEPLEPRRGEEGLDEDALHPGEHADAHAEQVLFGRQGGGADRHAPVLHEEVLHDAGAQDDAQEEQVVEEAMEDVVLLRSELPRVDLVEDLEEDEGVEDERVVLGLLGGGEGAIDGVDDEEGHAGFVGVPEKARSTEEKDEKDCDLEDGLPKDVSPHDRGDNTLGALVRGVVKDILCGRLGG